MIAYLNEHDMRVTAEALEKGRKEGRKEGLKEGLKEGREEERSALKALSDALVPCGRGSDLARAITDLTFRSQLIAELFPGGLPTK